MIFPDSHIVCLIVGMGWFDAIQFCFGATTSYGKARAKSCIVPGDSMLGYAC